MSTKTGEVHSDSKLNELDEGIDGELEITLLPGGDIEGLRKAQCGQGRFRRSALDREGKCRLTSVSDPARLIASHIKPWRISTADEEVDPNNGLALTPNADRLFDRGDISIAEDGRLLIRDGIEATALVYGNFL